MAVLSLALAAALLAPPTLAPQWCAGRSDLTAAVLVAPQNAPGARTESRHDVPKPDKRDEAASVVPEPTPFLLVGIGLVGLAISSRRWRRAMTGNKL